MELELLNAKQAKSRSEELMALQMFRPSHRVINFYDTKNNKIILTEYQDWMSTKKEDIGVQCQKFLAVETEEFLDELLALLPPDTHRNDPMLFRATNSGRALFFLINDDHYYVFGLRREMHRIMESEIDGLVLLGEVGASGEFRFSYLPRFGFCIRILSQYDMRMTMSKKRRSFFDLEDEEEDLGSSDVGSQVNYAGMFMLLNARGEAIFECFDGSVDNARLRKFLDTKDKLDEKFARRIQYWSYPMPFDIENPYDRWSRSYHQRNWRAGALPDVTSVTPEVGKGFVTITYRTADKSEATRTEKCCPYAEYSYAESFYR